LKYFVFAGYAVAQLVEALYYKLEGRGFDYRWGHLVFLLTQFFSPLCGLGSIQSLNRNEYQGYLL
jgi:hypothetical protein